MGSKRQRERYLWDGGKVRGEARNLWGGARGISPPAVWVGRGVCKVCPVSFEGIWLVTVWGNVGNLGLDALVFCKCVGIVCDDGCGGPDGGELAGGYGLADGCIVVGHALGGCIWRESAEAGQGGAGETDR